MILRISKSRNNRIFRLYLSAMFALMVIRYLLKVDVPAGVFLVVALLPICFGTKSEQLAFVSSCIPLSVAFQYKYALLFLAIVMLIQEKGRLRASSVFVIVMIMMIWEFLHVFFGYFSFVEYLRDFAELILLGIVTSVELKDLDHRLIIRSLSFSVVGVCLIMFVMQLQQYDFNLLEIFARSARSFRFGQSNMEAGSFALNFNANNLGFICNLSLCGMLLLVTRNEYGMMEVSLAIGSFVFALFTMSRAAIVCSVMIFGGYLSANGDSFSKKIKGVLVGIVLGIIVLLVIWRFVPSVYENILERFQREDVWNGRGSLLLNYGRFLISSPIHFLFGIGMQHIFEKVSPLYPVHDVPHMGIQEVWVAWGLVGALMMFFLFWRFIKISRRYSDGDVHFYQYMPLLLVVVFTMSGQLLTSSRALLAITFSFICLCFRSRGTA